jgi:hypothetical protein
MLRQIILIESGIWLPRNVSLHSISIWTKLGLGNGMEAGADQLSVLQRSVETTLISLGEILEPGFNL